MINVIFTFTLLIFVAMMTGCTTMQPIETTTVGENQKVPDWYLEPGNDTSDEVFASASAISDNMEFSMAKASHQARIILAEKIASTSSETLKQFNSDNAKNGTSKTTQATEQVTKSEFNAINVGGYRIQEKAVFREGNMYRSFILLSLPREDRFMINNNINEFSQDDKERSVKALDSI